MKFSQLAFTALISILFLSSCSDDLDQPVRHIPLGNYDSGVLVLNQGGFGHGDASMSYISSDFGTHENDIFSSVNQGIRLGDTAQDIGFYNQLAYIVVNGSNTIEIVNRYTMEHLATIDTGLSNPRYITFLNGKGYVTNWGDGNNPNDDYVAIINLTSNSVSGSIPVAEGPERIIEHAGKLYVAQTGGIGYGNAISVINLSNNAVSEIAVGDVPNSMQVKDGFLWVTCSGDPFYSGLETAGKLVKVNLANNTIANTFSYNDPLKHLSNLVIEGAFAYYTVNRMNGSVPISDVYKFDISANSLPTVPAFTTPYEIYSFAIKQNHIYVGDAVDYQNNGKVKIYSLGIVNDQAEIGTLENTYMVGVIPAGFYFNF